MSFDANSLLVSLLVGSVGFVLLVYGKKMSRIPHMAVGILMLVYPYFIPSALISFLIFVVLSGLLIAAVKLGH
ncbi:MAG: hypothetical protein U0263_39725 [Polyangiaceae bacterium]